MHKASIEIMPFKQLWPINNQKAKSQCFFLHRSSLLMLVPLNLYLETFGTFTVLDMKVYNEFDRNDVDSYYYDIKVQTWVPTMLNYHLSKQLFYTLSP